MNNNTGLVLVVVSASLLVGVSLSACDARVQVGKYASAASAASASAETNAISEICYDGVVYLTTPQGGLAPKVNKSDTGALMGMSQSPFVKCP